MQQSPSWKLTGSQPVEKFPEFYAIRQFISAFKRACETLWKELKSGDILLLSSDVKPRVTSMNLRKIMWNKIMRH
jgi:hypothetical protein